MMMSKLKLLRKISIRDPEFLILGITGIQGSPSPKGWWETLCAVSSTAIPFIPVDPLSWIVVGGVVVGSYAAYRGYLYFTRLDIPDVSTPKVEYARTQEYNNGFN